MVRERNILMSLSKDANYNPYIVRAYNSFQDNINVFIKMDMI